MKIIRKETVVRYYVFFESEDVARMIKEKIIPKITEECIGLWLTEEECRQYGVDLKNKDDIPDEASVLCPMCDKPIPFQIDSAGIPPRPGDLAICSECANIFILQSDFTLRAIAEENLSYQHKMALVEAKKIAEKFKAIRKEEN